jgi:hypothetical protein
MCAIVAFSRCDPYTVLNLFAGADSKMFHLYSSPFLDDEMLHDHIRPETSTSIEASKVSFHACALSVSIQKAEVIIRRLCLRASIMLPRSGAGSVGRAFDNSSAFLLFAPIVYICRCH